MGELPPNLKQWMRFSPSDEKVMDFLRSKITGNDREVHFIFEAQSCRWDPWDLRKVFDSLAVLRPEKFVPILVVYMRHKHGVSRVVALLATGSEWEAIKKGNQCWILESDCSAKENHVGHRIDRQEKLSGILYRDSSGQYNPLGNARVLHNPEGTRWHPPRSGWFLVFGL